MIQEYQRWMFDSLLINLSKKVCYINKGNNDTFLKVHDLVYLLVPASKLMCLVVVARELVCLFEVAIERVCLVVAASERLCMVVATIRVDGLMFRSAT